MLRPKRMSRVSVTGSKRVMDETVEAIHDLNLLHVTDYDDTWEGFEPGDPVEGAEEAAQKLVTVRALQSTLGVTEEDAGRARIIEDDELDEELEETRQRVNELDDRRSELEDELREIDDNVEAARPFAELGIDLDLLGGFDSLTVAVGEADAGEVRASLADAEAVEEYRVFEEGRYVALFVYPDLEVQDVLVGTPFTEYEVPELGDSDEATSPEEYIDDLRSRRRQVESRLETVEHELEDLRHEVASFLLAAEEKLAIEVQKREAPLTFATTENAFVAEGWIPTERFPELDDALQSAVGDHVEVEELERAEYDEHGHAHDREELDEGTGPTHSPDEGEGAAVADGGHQMSGGEPPVVQDNPEPVKPFEMLVGVINRPKYTELDPTFVLFLTFPAFFGFMIGDVGYGILYALFGYAIMRRFESPGIRSLGGIGIWAGLFTILFGFLYGEFFGFHELGEIVWGGHPPMEKGLSPATISFAWAWLVISLVVALVHLTVGHIFGFIDDLSHGIVEAVAENLSWVFLMVGVWAWVFSEHLKEAKPLLLYSTFNEVGEEVTLGDETITLESHQVAYEFGFSGLSPEVGLAGLGVAAIGFVLMLYGETLHMGKLGIIVGALESLNVLVNVLSYARIAAVLLAKAGMAFVVNLLVFGAYEDEEGGVHFIANNYEGLHEVHGEVIFPGLLTDASGAGFIVAALAGIVILVIGHLLVLALGITSAGLQGVRLEYVEFFNKFYEGGGKKFDPFGYDRTYTTED